MTFNWWTFLFQALNFVVLAYVLHRLLYRPLHDAIDRRRQANAEAQARAETARREAEVLQAQLQAQLADAQKQRQQVIHEAHEQALVERRKLLGEGEQALLQRREEARQSLARERDETIEALRGEVIDQALDLARRLLAGAADRSLHRQLALHLAEELRQLPEARREQVRQQWQADDGALLEVAQELDEATLQALTDVVAGVLGQRVSLNVAVLPALVGGARLRLAGQLWDASLAGQLQPARKEGTA